MNLTAEKAHRDARRLASDELRATEKRITDLVAELRDARAQQALLVELLATYDAHLPPLAADPGVLPLASHAHAGGGR